MTLILGCDRRHGIRARTSIHITAMLREGEESKHVWSIAKAKPGHGIEVLEGPLPSQGGERLQTA